VTVRTSCHSNCEAGRRTAQTVLLINVMREALKSVCLFILSTIRAVCYRTIDWKKGLELDLYYWMKSLEFLRVLAQESCCHLLTLFIAVRVNLTQNRRLTSRDWKHVVTYWTYWSLSLITQYAGNFPVLASSALAPCGLRGCKNWPALFPGRMSYKATKPGLALSVVYLSMFYCIVVY